MNVVPFSEGRSIRFTPSADVAAGEIIDLGGLVGYVSSPAAANIEASLQVDGEVTVIKSGSSGPVFSVGELVYYDRTNKLAKKGGTNQVLIGVCTKAAETTDTSVRVLLGNATMVPGWFDKVFEDLSLAGGSKTLDNEDCGKVMNVTVGHATNVITLPATVNGFEYVIRSAYSGGLAIQVSPNAADRIEGADLTLADDVDRKLAAGAAKQGDYLHILGTPNGWSIRAYRGSWT